MLRFCFFLFLISATYAAPRRNIANFEDLSSRPPTSDLIEDPTSILVPFFRPGALANPSSFLNKLTSSGNTLDISQFLDSEFLRSFKSSHTNELKPVDVQSDLPADKDIGRVFASALKNLFRRTQLTQLEDFQHSAVSQLNNFFTQIQSMTKQFGTLFGNDQLGLTLPAANRSENSSLLLSTITTTPSIPIVFADAPKPDSKLPPQTHVVGNFPEISLNIDAGPQTFDKEADVRSSSASKTDSRVTGALNSEITNGTANGIATTPKIVTVDLNDFVLTAEFLGDLLKEKGGLKSLMDLLNDPVARKSLIPGFGA